MGPDDDILEEPPSYREALQMPKPTYLNLPNGRKFYSANPMNYGSSYSGIQEASSSNMLVNGNENSNEEGFGSHSIIPNPKPRRKRITRRKSI